MIQPTKPSARQWRPNILIYGASGTGKTKTWLDLRAITGARALVIDTHHGTDAWSRIYPDGWDVVHSASPVEMEAQIRHYCAIPGKYTMFIIDDITVPIAEVTNMADDELRPAKQRRDQSIGMFSGVIDIGTWGPIKRIIHRPLNALTHLDMARIVVARSQPHYEQTGDGKRRLVGSTWKGDKEMDYSFDLVLQLERFGDVHTAVRIKARGLPDFPMMIEEFTAEKLLAHLPCGVKGFTDPTTPEPLIDATQANDLRALLARAALEPGRQSRALQHFGATSIDDVPARQFAGLVAALHTVIAQRPAAHPAALATEPTTLPVSSDSDSVS